MARYAVLKPCVVGNLHYARIPDGPIEVEDDATYAAALVAAGALAPVDAPEPAEAPHRRRAKGD